MTELTSETLLQQKQAEQLFAAAAFTSPDFVLSECGWLRPEIILHDGIRRFWAGMQEGKEAVEAALDSGILADVMGWQNDLPTALAARDYANHILKNEYLSRVSVGAGKLANAVMHNDVQEAQDIITDLHNNRPVQDRGIYTALEVNDAFAEYVERGGYVIKTGIPGIDNNAGGLMIQTTSVLAGRPSMGKSALALQIARSVAYPVREKVAFFALEMSKVNIWARAACPLVGLTWMEVVSGNITADQKKRLLKASRELAEQYGDYLLIDDRRQTMESIWQTVAKEKPRLVIIDHLRLLKDSSRESENKRLGLITERGHDMAKAQDCHVMFVAQLNRGVEDRNDKRPMLSDLRDSGEIEENVDQAFMMYRDDYYNPESTTPGITEVWVRKFRDGTRDALINLFYNMKTQWFEPVEVKRVNLNQR